MKYVYEWNSQPPYYKKMIMCLRFSHFVFIWFSQCLRSITVNYLLTGSESKVSECADKEAKSERFQLPKKLIELQDRYGAAEKERKRLLRKLQRATEVPKIVYDKIDSHQCNYYLSD